MSHRASHSTIHEGRLLTPVERSDLIVEVRSAQVITVGEWNKFIETCPPQ